MHRELAGKFPVSQCVAADTQVRCRLPDAQVPIQFQQRRSLQRTSMAEYQTKQPNYTKPGYRKTAGTRQISHN